LTTLDAATYTLGNASPSGGAFSLAPDPGADSSA
jgi:hypothetical protein